MRLIDSVRGGFLKFIFNRRIIALQYCVGFCHTSTRISHRYTYVPSLWTSLPSLIPPHTSAAAAAAKLLQSCPTLCDPIEGSPPGSSIPGILQARTLEWVAISFPNAWKWKVKWKSLSRVRLLATPWTAAYQAPPSMGFSRQEYWSPIPLVWYIWVPWVIRQIPINLFFF